MLGNKKSRAGTTLISRNTVLVGDIHFSGSLEIEGLVQGNILSRPDSDAVVCVVDKGRVEGEIRAPGVIINGSVSGNVYSTRLLELAPKARVQGNVFYTTVEMAAGSEVNGSLTHIDEEAAVSEQSPDLRAEESPAEDAQDRSQAASTKVD